MVGAQPEHRRIEAGVRRVNVARIAQGVTWQASDGFPGSYDGAKVLDGEVCDASGRNGYWAGRKYRLPVTMELAFPEPATIDTNVIIWYTTDIRGTQYRLEGLKTNGEWIELYRVRANRYRDAVHRFPAQTVTKVRFTLEGAAGQNRVVMRELLLYNELTADEEKILMDNAARCLGPNEKSRIVNLGVPVKAVTYGNSQGTVGPSPDGGHPIFYLSYYNTGGAELLAYDMTARKVYRWDLPSGSGGYGLTTGKDGRIYVGMVGRGNLVQFDPATQTMRDLGNAGQPTTYVWSCATSSDGKIFGAGYPKCVALVYDPATDKLTSPGSIEHRPGSEYLRAVAADGRGRAWFGVSTRGGIVVYDPADGSQRDVLPAEHAAVSRPYQLVRAGSLMYVTMLYNNKVLVFDADSCELVRKVSGRPGDTGLFVGASDSHGNVYANAWPAGDLCVLRPDATELEVIAPHLGGVKTILGDRYLLIFFDQTGRIFDLETRQVIDERQWIEPKAGMQIFTLTQGPDGKIYGSTYINQHFFRYDPGSEQLEDLGRIIYGGGQCDSICCSRDGKQVWMGCYAQAYLAAYDPTRPYKLGTEPDCNPRDFGRLGKGQYRTKAIVQGPLGKIYVGSIPSYNSAPTGALSIFDPKTMRKNVMTDFVPGGSVYCLAATDRFVYGSGGGQLFKLDPQTERKAHERSLACAAMIVAGDGTLVVSAAGYVQGLDPGTLATQWQIPLSQIDKLKGFHQFALGPQGQLYGLSDLGIFRIDREASRLVQLTKLGSKHLAADREGRLYFSAGASLCVYDPR